MDFYNEQDGFGFSRDTSPARGDAFQQAGGKMHLLANPGKQDGLFVSTSTRKVFGQYTPPTSMTSPSKDTPFFDDMVVSEPLEPESDNEYDDSHDQDFPSGEGMQKRRSARQHQSIGEPTQPASTPRRRRKTGRKVDSNEKRSQFLERNRVAASKCRQKKKEWTTNLEGRARELQATKNSMALLVASLREELLYLKGEALKHTTCDCNAVRKYLARQAESPFSYERMADPQSPFLSENHSMDLNRPMMHRSPGEEMSDELPELSMLNAIPD